MPMLRVVALAGLMALAACGDDRAEKRAEDRPDTAKIAAQKIAEGKLREGARTEVTLRAVQSYAQAAPGVIAVCGQVRFGGGGEPFLPFVTVVYEPGRGAAPKVEHFVALSSTAATRVYIETMSRCHDGGGPDPRHRGIEPLPPVPSEDALRQALRPMEAPASPPAAPPPAPQPATAPATPPVPQSASGVTVTMRQHGNIRAHPHGGGAVTGVVPQGTVLRVYGTAPGGWYEVGDSTTVLGWVHGSLLVSQP